MQSKALMSAVQSAGFSDLHFDTPWAARLFGMTLAASEQGLFTLSDFQNELIAAIQLHEKDGCISNDDEYYTCWLNALQSLLEQHQLIVKDQLVTREQEVMAAAQERHDHQRHGHHVVKPENIQ